MEVSSKLFRLTIFSIFTIAVALSAAEAMETTDAVYRKTTKNSFFIKPGITITNGSLAGLKNKEALFVDKSEKHFKLIYFGTANRIASCSVDIAIMQLVVDFLEARCGTAVANKVTPVLVFPELDKSLGLQPLNIETYIDNPSSRIVGLSGTLNEVMELAGRYQSKYKVSKKGVVQSHTRQTYLIAPDGQNIAIFAGGTPFGLIAEEIILSMMGDAAIDLSAKKGCVPSSIKREP